MANIFRKIGSHNTRLKQEGVPASKRRVFQVAALVSYPLAWIAGKSGLYRRGDGYIEPGKTPENFAPQQRHAERATDAALFVSSVAGAYPAIAAGAAGIIEDTIEAAKKEKIVTPEENRLLAVSAISSASQSVASLREQPRSSEEHLSDDFIYSKPVEPHNFLGGKGRSS